MNRNELIQKNLRLAQALVSRYTFYAPRSSAAWQDAYGVACVALCEAADLFDASRGAKFATLAFLRIRNAIHDFRRGEAQRWDFERAAGEDAMNVAAEGSPEDYVLEAERAEVVFDRMSRLTPAERARVEAALFGERRVGNDNRRSSVLKLVEKVGGEAQEAPWMGGAQRSARWYANLGPEQRAARNAKRRARKASKKAEGRAA